MAKRKERIARMAFTVGLRTKWMYATTLHRAEKWRDECGIPAARRAGIYRWRLAPPPVGGVGIRPLSNPVRVR